MASKGILGRKLGMTQVWDADNRVVPVTVIQAGPCRVVQLKTPERDGYAAVQLAFGDAKPARLTKPELGHLKAADAAPAKHLAELRVDDLSGFEIGQVLAKPNSITPHTNFQAQVYVLNKDEGGRHTPFFVNYRPQFYFRTTDITGSITLPDGVEMVMPGDNIEMTVELIAPIAMEEGLRFAIREGGRTVGAGRVTKINK